MDNKDAIKCLTEIKEKLRTDNYFDYIITSQAQEYLSNIFGRESHIYKRFTSELSSVAYASDKNILSNRDVAISFQRKFPAIIDTAIETINNFGVPQNDTPIIRFIKNNPNWSWSLLTSLIVFTSIGSFWVGHYINKIDSNKIENENSRLSIENATLREENRIYKLNYAP
ncbi:hypothetical protein LK994_12320 [Ferruginibacter lapsinanis]|uniref:hypothetical protein n=1 Tax=Ferruginibacter lapsinanis TaxID=563172 RepID=UPI001E5E2A61|nr:hypothetical protein [Ferruginibacter lapsinanis]UEG49417.1 hypothetical protein LK994_12320 [Ferruginibacter lapsinanis]